MTERRKERDEKREVRMGKVRATRGLGFKRELLKSCRTVSTGTENSWVLPMSMALR